MLKFGVIDDDVTVSQIEKKNCMQVVSRADDKINIECGMVSDFSILSMVTNNSQCYNKF